MDLNNVKQQFDNELNTCDSIENLDKIKAYFLSKKGPILSLFSSFKDLSKEEKVELGQQINVLKDYVTEELEKKREVLLDSELDKKIESEKINITLPSRKVEKGSRNPIQLIIDRVTDIFVGLGYNVVSGPEVEKDYYNFELLNTPKDHPARDMQDSFFIDENTLLRSHTSAVQAHIMENAHGQVPIKIICPGKVYRRDSDATHSHQFNQIEGLVIDKDVTIGNLMETLTIFLKELFGQNREVRFRPSFFPFTEPSLEVDVSCFNCHGKGCSLCKGSGWIEVLGSGMVHPNVLRLNGFDDKKYQGFAFGVGVDRLAMLLYGIDDIKRFYTNDVDFLTQFKKEGR